MNYLDYKQIMEDEELTLPKVAEYTLQEAAKCQRMIKVLRKERQTETIKQHIKELDEMRVYWIISAIEWARVAKEAPDAFKWGDRLMERMERRK